MMPGFVHEQQNVAPFATSQVVRHRMTKTEPLANGKLNGVRGPESPIRLN